MIETQEMNVKEKKWSKTQLVARSACAWSFYWSGINNKKKYKRLVLPDQ